MSKQHPGSVTSYTSGFLLSIILTLIPFWLVIEGAVSGSSLLVLLALFAIAQVLVQIQFFLHLGQEPKPRWHGTAFKYMVMVVVIIVFGSIWIMNNLHYNMMPGHEVDTYIKDEEAIERTH